MSNERRAKWPGEVAPAAMLRFIVGCEDIEDLRGDFEHGLEPASAIRRMDATPVQIQLSNGAER